MGRILFVGIVQYVYTSAGLYLHELFHPLSEIWPIVINTQPRYLLSTGSVVLLPHRASSVLPAGKGRDGSSANRRIFGDSEPDSLRN